MAVVGSESPDPVLASSSLLLLGTGSGQNETRIVRLEKAARSYNIKWHSDGQHLLAELAPLLASNAMELCRFNLQDGSYETLHAGRSAMDWSADGTRLFVYGEESREPKDANGQMYENGASLYEVDAKTGQRRLVYRSGPQIGFVSAYLSPDESWIAIPEDKFEDGNVTARWLSLVNLKNGTKQQLTEAYYFCGWSSDSKRVLFRFRGPGDSELQFRALPVEGGKPEKIDFGVKGIQQIAPHPDGRRFAVSVVRTGTEYWVMENFLPKSKDNK